MRIQAEDDDSALLTALYWGPWREKRQEALKAGVLARYSKFDRALEDLNKKEIATLASEYPLRWQRNALTSAWSYLVRERISPATLRRRLRQLAPLVARGELQTILGTEGEKIPDCLLRDWLQLDAFPIDTRAARILDVYGVPPSSPVVVAACQTLDIPIRPFARALYYVYERLRAGHERTSDFGPD